MARSYQELGMYGRRMVQRCWVRSSLFHRRSDRHNAAVVAEVVGPIVSQPPISAKVMGPIKRVERTTVQWHRSS